MEQRYIYSYSDHYKVEIVHIYQSIITTIRRVSRELKFNSIFIDLEDELKTFIDHMIDHDQTELTTTTLINTGNRYNIIVSITINDLLLKSGKIKKQRVLKKIVSISVNCSEVH